MSNRARIVSLALALLLGAALTVNLGARASSPGDTAPQAVVRYAEQRAVSPPLRFLCRPALPDNSGDLDEIPRPAGPRAQVHPRGDGDAGGEYDPGRDRGPGIPVPWTEPDGILVPWTEPVAPAMPTPAVSFGGGSNADNRSLLGSWIVPPDTNGDVGPNHYVQMLNLTFGIWDKSGTRLVGPLTTRSLWSGLGGLCASNSRGDPIVLYDSLADRWLMSEFAFETDWYQGWAMGPFYECIAISRTSDPTGQWYLYSFLVSETKMNDYPKLGVWPDGYYMSVNQFQEFSESWAGAGVAVFERSKMLEGEPARMVYFDVGAVNLGYFGMLPSDLDGSNQPPSDPGSAGPPNFFVEWDDSAWLGDPQDTLRIWEFHADWSDPARSSFGLAGHAPNELVPTSNVDPNLCSYLRDCIPQPNTTQRVDAISDRLMYRLAYRRFGGHEALVANHSVDVNGANHAGIHWFELRRLGDDWSLYQEGVYAPDESDRWMGSMAMDQAGNIALGYSVSSADVYPSVRYSGRLAEDPAGQMAQGEAVLVAGRGSQLNIDRWGDYSMMAVDPVDDCTFWYTQQYYDESGMDWQTRIGAFKFPSCKRQWANLAITKSATPK